MTTVVGRIRRDPLFHLKFVVLSHNTIRGAAGGSIYNAELLVQEGLL
jgi:aspartate-semialdehyde dehydrogenase